MGQYSLTRCVVLSLIVAAAPILTAHAAAQSGTSLAAVDASSDAAATLGVGQNLTWTHTPVGSPSLVTVSCGVHQTGVVLSVAYGGRTMSGAITNQQSNQYLGLFYLRDPSSGARTVAVNLSAAGGQANIQCSGTTWTGVNGVDLSIANSSEDLSGAATSITLRPTSPVPEKETFFVALHRYMPQGAPAFSLSGTDANAVIVDSDTDMGNGSGNGCQAVGFAQWEDCIGTAQLAAGGTSVTFYWVSNGYAVAAGVGLVEGAVPGQPHSGADTILGVPTVVFVALIVVVGVSVAGAVVVAWRYRAAARPPKP